MNLNFKEFKRFEKQIILKKIGSPVKKNKKGKNSNCRIRWLGMPISFLSSSIRHWEHMYSRSDKVELGNLNRQILFNNGDLNKFKVLQAKKVAQIIKI